MRYRIAQLSNQGECFALSNIWEESAFVCETSVLRYGTHCQKITKSFEIILAHPRFLRYRFRMWKKIYTIEFKHFRSKFHLNIDIFEANMLWIFTICSVQSSLFNSTRWKKWNVFSLRLQIGKLTRFASLSRADAGHVYLTRRTIHDFIHVYDDSEFNRRVNRKRAGCGCNISRYYDDGGYFLRGRIFSPRCCEVRQREDCALRCRFPSYRYENAFRCTPNRRAVYAHLRRHSSPIYACVYRLSLSLSFSRRISTLLVLNTSLIRCLVSEQNTAFITQTARSIFDSGKWETLSRI